MDQTLIGDANPDYTWGLSNTFSWKGLDVSFLLQSVVGADIINTLNIRFHTLDGRRNVPKHIWVMDEDGSLSCTDCPEDEETEGHIIIDEEGIDIDIRDDDDSLKMKIGEDGVEIKTDN